MRFVTATKAKQRLEALLDAGIAGTVYSIRIYRLAVSMGGTVPAREADAGNSNLVRTTGFSLHAGVAAKAHQRRKLARLCRYDVQGSTSVAGGRKPGATIARPAAATDRLALTLQGYVRYDVKGFTNVCLGTQAAGEPYPFSRIILILARFAGPLKRSKLRP